MSAPSAVRQLQDVEAALRLDPGHRDLLYLRATLLAGLGRNEDARQGFLSVLGADPTHFGALNDLGTLLHRTDFRAAARTAYAEAVRHHPSNSIGRINLGNALFADGQWEAARRELEAALELSPEDPDAHQGLANVFQELGDWELAERHRQQSYRERSISVQPYRGSGAPARVLLLVSAVGGNIPTRFLLDDQTFETSILVAEAHAAHPVLPPHDLVFNAVGDADLCASALDAVDAVLERSVAPVINRTGPVRKTGRSLNARRLSGLAGVRAPRVEQVDRSRVEEVVKASFRYPLLLRSLGFHTGRHFTRVDDAGALALARDGLPGAELLVIEYLEAGDLLGRHRKYRAMFIGGAVFPLHLAISHDWKVHYFTADMADRPDHRAEEAKFLNDMGGFLGDRTTAALTALAERLDLDYGGVDFGVGEDGELLLFEANATMVVNPPPPDGIWDYRRSAVDRIYAAARALLTTRAGTARG